MSTSTAADLSYLDNTGDDPKIRARLVVGDNDFHSVTERVCGIPEMAKKHVWSTVLVRFPKLASWATLVASTT